MKPPLSRPASLAILAVLLLGLGFSWSWWRRGPDSGAVAELRAPEPESRPRPPVAPDASREPDAESGPGKFRVRPGADELEGLRRERERAEILAERDRLEAGGLGARHPNMRQLQQQLEALDDAASGTGGAAPEEAVSRGYLGITLTGSPPMIGEVVPGSPAAEAGVLPGDVLLGVDGQSVEGRAIDEILGMLRGSIGEPVTLTIGRGPEAVKVFTLRRATLDELGR